jgi:hypothetical protein
MENHNHSSTAKQDLSTKEVLVQKRSDKLVYFIPCYVRLKVKSISDLDMVKASGTIDGTLLFSYYYGNLPSEVLERIYGKTASKAIVLQIAGQKSIKLKEGNKESDVTIKRDEKHQTITYVIRTEFQCSLDGNVFCTPFELFDLFLSITVQTVVLEDESTTTKSEPIRLRFNCMKSNEFRTIHTDSTCDYGTYSLAPYFLNSDVSNCPNHRFLPISMLDPTNQIDLTTKLKAQYNDSDDENVDNA